MNDLNDTLLDIASTRIDDEMAAAHQHELEHRRMEEEQTADQDELLAEERRRLLTARDIRFEDPAMEAAYLQALSMHDINGRAIFQAGFEAGRNHKEGNHE